MGWLRDLFKKPEPPAPMEIRDLLAPTVNANGKMLRYDFVVWVYNNFYSDYAVGWIRLPQNPDNVIVFEYGGYDRLIPECRLCENILSVSPVPFTYEYGIVPTHLLGRLSTITLTFADDAFEPDPPTPPPIYTPHPSSKKNYEIYLAMVKSGEDTVKEIEEEY